MHPTLKIKDGQTRKGTIEGRPGLWPELHFKYRRALPEAVYEYLEPKANGKAKLAADIAMIRQYVLWWDAVDERGATEPISEETLRAWPASVLGQLCNFICSYSAGEAADDAKNSDAA